MNRLIAAPALAALVMFVFGAIYWMSPLPYRSLSRVPDDDAAMAALDQAFPSTGAYFLPGMYLDAKRHEQLAHQGPIAEVHIVKSGLPILDPGQLLQGYVHEFMISLVLIILLQVSGAADGGFRSVVKFCVLIGVLHALCDYSYSVWWYHSWAWQTVQAVYDLIAFTLAGLVLGKFVGRKSPVTPVEHAHEAMAA